MVKNFKHLMDLAIKKETGKIAVVSADHLSILEVIAKSIEINLAEFILIGNKKKIEKIIEDNSLDINSEIIDSNSDKESAELGIKLILDGRAQLIMKGILHSSTFLKALLNKDYQLKGSGLISQASIIEKTDKDGFMILTDCAISVEPSLHDKKLILENSAKLSSALGENNPKAAILSAVEVVNPNMPDTLDAAALSKMSDRGQLGNLTVDGPLAFDNIISKKSALEKGIKSELAGEADIILMPNLLVGNALSKAISSFTGKPMVSAMLGMKIPVIFNSRTESMEGKLLSIALSKYMA